MQVGSGSISKVRKWSAKWRTLSKCNIVCSAWPTVRCHRPVTPTTTVMPTTRASSTHTTLRWSPTQPTWSLTAPGPGRDRASATSCKRHGMPETTLTLITLCADYIHLIIFVHFIWRWKCTCEYSVKHGYEHVWLFLFLCIQIQQKTSERSLVFREEEWLVGATPSTWNIKLNNPHKQTTTGRQQIIKKVILEWSEQVSVSPQCIYTWRQQDSFVHVVFLPCDCECIRTVLLSKSVRPSVWAFVRQTRALW